MGIHKSNFSVRKLHAYKKTGLFINNAHGNVLYTGVTKDLIRRVCERKNKMVPGLTQKYNVNRLVYFEVCPDIMTVISREKQIKGWSRKKKNDLVNALNSEWADLYQSLC